MGGARGAGLIVAAVSALGAVGLAAPAYADGTVTVQGTAFPDPTRADLSFVGCADLYQRGDETLAPTVGVGPGDAPSGTRSLGWDLAGGNAVGAEFPVASMLSTTTASMAVNADGRASGVAYAAYQAPADAGTSLLWVGRSELVTPGGAWQTVDATTRLYTWAQYDMQTREPVNTWPGAPATVSDFASAQGGDGPGVYTIGFGCDGTPFSMDSLRVGSAGNVTTFDMEGLRTQVTIHASKGGSTDGVTLTGQLRTGTGDPIPDATMILESRDPGSSVWKTVQVADVGTDGGVHATVPAGSPTYYRWRFVERPLAEGSTSTPLLVGGLQPPPPPPTTTPSPSVTPSPTDPPTTTPSTTPSSTPSDTPPSTPSSSPSDSDTPTSTDQPTPTETISESISDWATPSASQTVEPTGGTDDSSTG